MHSMGARVAGLLEDLLGLNDLVNACFGWVGLRIHDINTRGTEPGNDQIAALEKRVTGERRRTGWLAT